MLGVDWRRSRWKCKYSNRLRANIFQFLCWLKQDASSFINNCFIALLWSPAFVCTLAIIMYLILRLQWEMQFDSQSRRSKIYRDVKEIKVFTYMMHYTCFHFAISFSQASSSYAFTSAGESNLCMYDFPPNEEISLRYFETLVEKRLKALKVSNLRHSLHFSCNLFLVDRRAETTSWERNTRWI